MKHLFTSLVFALSCTLTAADELPSSAPLFAATLSDLDDKPVALARYKGKPLVVNEPVAEALDESEVENLTITKVKG